MIGDHRGEPIFLVAAPIDEPSSRPREITRSPEDALVRDIAQERVLEREFDVALELRRLVPVDELLDAQGVERRAHRLTRLFSHSLDRLAPELAPDDRGSLEDDALPARQAVEAGLDDARQCRGTRTSTSLRASMRQRSGSGWITPWSMSILISSST